MQRLIQKLNELQVRYKKDGDSIEITNQSYARVLENYLSNDPGFKEFMESEFENVGGYSPYDPNSEEQMWLIVKKEKEATEPVSISPAPELPEELVPAIETPEEFNAEDLVWVNEGDAAKIEEETVVDEPPVDIPVEQPKKRGRKKATE